LGVIVIGGVGAVAFWEYREQPQFCGLCHNVQPYLESWEASDYGAHAHAEYDVACLDCHVPTLEEVVNGLVVYLQGEYEVPLKEMNYPKDDCFRCHEHGSYEQIIEMTADLKSAVGANPHDSPLLQIECQLCHKMHRDSEDYCAQCHAYVWDVP
jgi:formate-dependent nitrite reductase cytochrome c552 subunit